MMTKKYIIEQIKRVKEMITTQESSENIKKLKEGKRNEISIKMSSEIGHIQYKYIKNRKLESATIEALINLLEEIIKYGFEHDVKGFDGTFTY